MANKLFRFSRQLILAFFLGISSDVDLLLVAQIIPTIFLSVIGGAGGETLVTLIKNGRVDKRVVGLFIFILQLLGLVFSVVFFLCVPTLSAFFDLAEISKQQYLELSFLLILNIFPGVIVSVATPLLYLDKYYRYYAVSTILSEIIGLITIVALVSGKGILAFPIATLITSTTNMVLFLFRLKPDFGILFRGSEWVQLLDQFKSVFSRMGIISGQTLLNYLAVFWDRSFGIRFLEPGYLSSLNYATTTFELPNLIYNKSIGTTTYINQLKYSQEDKKQFEDYSKKIFKLTLFAAYLVQALFVLAAPALIILLYRRGKFDNESVAATQIVLEILAMGLAPSILLLFGSRMLYALQNFKFVFQAVLSRVLLKVILVTVLISSVPHILPISTTVSLYVAMFFVFVMIKKITHVNFLSPAILILLLALLCVNGLSIYLNKDLYHLYINFPTWGIFVFLLTLFGLSFIGLWIFLKKQNLLDILKKN